MDEGKNNNISFSELVALRRNKLNMSLHKLAKKTGVNVSYLSRMENSTNSNPSFQNVLKIANALDISLQTLLEVFNLQEEKIGVYDNSNAINDILYDKSQKTGLSLLETSVTEKEIMSDILLDLLQLRDKQKLDFNGLIQLIQDVQALFSKKSTDNYSIITKIDNEYFKVLQTPVWDENLGYYYFEITDMSNSDSYILQGNVLQYPDETATYDIYTIEDLFKAWETMGKEEYNEIAPFVEKFKKHYHSLLNSTK